MPDIRSAIKKAIEALPNRCGTIEIAAGRYEYSSTIVKPRYVIIRGQGTGATHLIYTATTGTAVAIGDELGTQQYQHGGIRDLSIETPHSAPSNKPVPGARGMFIGGDPSGEVLGKDFAAEVLTDSDGKSKYRLQVVNGSLKLTPVR